MICLSRQHTVTGTPEDRAVPAGGALRRGRDCLWLVCAALFATTATAETTVTVPSHMDVSLLEILSDDGVNGSLFRFRFVAPQITDSDLSVEQLSDDMAHICQAFALPKLAEIRAEPKQIVVSLSAQATEYGVATPEVRQVFEAFSVQDGSCIWEPF